MKYMNYDEMVKEAYENIKELWEKFLVKRTRPHNKILNF